MKSKLILSATLLSFLNVSAMDQANVGEENRNPENGIVTQIPPVINGQDNPYPGNGVVTQIPRVINGQDNPLFYQMLANDLRLILEDHPIDEILNHYPEEEREVVRRIINLDIDNNPDCEKLAVRAVGALLSLTPVIGILGMYYLLPPNELPPSMQESLIASIAVSSAFLFTFTVLDSVPNNTPILGKIKRQLRPMRETVTQNRIGITFGITLLGIGYSIFKTLKASNSDSEVLSHIMSYCLDKLSNFTISNGKPVEKALSECRTDGLLNYFSINYFTVFCTLCDILICLVIW